MKEYTIVINCNLIDTIVEDDVEDGVDVENMIRSDLYKQRTKEWIKVYGNIDDVDITDIKLFVRDLDGDNN